MFCSGGGISLTDCFNKYFKLRLGLGLNILKTDGKINASKLLSLTNIINKQQVVQS